MSELIQQEDHGPAIVGVLLRRAERRNALSVELLEALCATVERLAATQSCRVLILRGDGPVFSAGLDLCEAMEETLVERSAGAVDRALNLLRDSRLVTIAAVHGGAFAGGAGLMAACDLAIAAENARIGFPEVRRGLVPALICGVLRTKVRDGDLRDLFLTGEAVTAERARQLGLVQRVVPSESLMEESLQVARSIVAGGPEAIRATKQLLASEFAAPPEVLPRSLRDWHLRFRRSDEAREGLRAFLEKRAPNWDLARQP